MDEAAGRQVDGTRKKNFSVPVLKYALNLGLPFKLPEELFTSSSLDFKLIGLSYKAT